MQQPGNCSLFPFVKSAIERRFVNMNSTRDLARPQSSTLGGMSFALGNPSSDQTFDRCRLNFGGAV